MAIRESGIRLVAQNYQTYRNQLRELNKLHKETFSGNSGINSFTSGLRKVTNEQRKMKSSSLEAWNVVENLRNSLNQTSSSGGGGGFFSNLLNSVTNLIPNLRAGGGAVGFLGGAITKLTGPIGLAIGGFLSLSKAISDFTKFAEESLAIATRNETLKVSLDELGRSAGYSQKQVDYAVESLKQQGITTSAASQSLMRMARANISWAEASKLAAIAQGAAVAAGMNSSDAFNRLVTGIQKMEPELLDELGITLRRSDAYDKFAKTLGVSAKSLTEQQKQQAILNEIYSQSEGVLGVYDAAMETSGKQMGSLARHIEEAKASFGKLLLPFQELKVASQTDYWKGIRDLTKGLESWAPIIRESLNGIKFIISSVIEDTKNLVNSLGVVADVIITTINPAFGFLKMNILNSMKEGESLFESLGRRAFESGKSVVDAFSYVAAIFTTVHRVANAVFIAISAAVKEFYKYFLERTKVLRQEIKDLGTLIFGAIGKAISKVGEYFDAVLNKIFDKTGKLTTFLKELAAALDIKLELPDFGLTEGISKVWEEELASWQKSMDEMFPLFNQSWDEFNKAAEKVDLKLPTFEGPSDLSTEEVEALVKVYEKLDDILRNYNKRLKEMQANAGKAFSDFQAETAKKEAEIRENNLKKIQEFDEESVKNRQKLIEDYGKQRVKAEQDLHRKLEQERKRFELSQLQAKRRFEIQDRRLRSEGDILALMDLRENYELEKQEAKENNDLQRQQEKENAKIQQQERDQDFQERLKEFDQQISEQRSKLWDAYRGEMEDFKQSRVEQFEEFKKSWTERYEELIKSRNEEIEELGRSLAAEKDITEEGMKAIADKIAEVFGEEQAGDALIKGWASRTESVFGQMIAELEADIQSVKDSMSQITTSVGEVGREIIRPSLDYRRGVRREPVFLPTITRGMRHGGEGVVTGPAHFFVEPGVKEHFAFSPVQGGSMRHSGNLSMGLNVSGMSSGLNQQLEQAVISKAADLVVSEISIAVERLKRR